MLQISAHNVGKSFGGPNILNGLDLAVQDGARIGLVGANGAGKSTLLRILSGLEEPDTGEVVRRRGLRTAYLPQHVPASEHTPIAILLAARADLAEVEEQLQDCANDLADPMVVADLEAMQRVLERQERLLARFEELGGPGYEGEARSHLRVLGFSEEEMSQPMAELSGGQRKLVAFAVCLAQRPEVLLLDEPETHLDLPHRERLERHIRMFDGAVVLISHDRYLLDETVGEIAELDRGAVTLWQGNYSAYTLARELALKRQQQLYAAQQKEIERLEEAIARFKLWASIVVDERHIKQARNKQRQIDRMEKVERPVLERRKMALRLRSAERGGNKVLELREVGVAFENEVVLLEANLLAARGERVGVIGANGAGKSVLTRVLSGELEPTTGTRWIGPSIRLGYFAQGHETLDPNKTPIETLRDLKPMREEQAVAHLGRFLFSYEQGRQRIGTLSGGERSRLQLLLLMLGEANCLLLDEPTNHLDIDSAEVLEAALADFDGTVVVVSHDRYFLDRIADRTVEVRDGTLHSYEGGYSAWAEQTRAGRD